MNSSNPSKVDKIKADPVKAWVQSQARDPDGNVMEQKSDNNKYIKNFKEIDKKSYIGSLKFSKKACNLYKKLIKKPICGSKQINDKISVFLKNENNSETFKKKAINAHTKQEIFIKDSALAMALAASELEIKNNESTEGIIKKVFDSQTKRAIQLIEGNPNWKKKDNKEWQAKNSKKWEKLKEWDSAKNECNSIEFTEPENKKHYKNDYLSFGDDYDYASDNNTLEFTDSENDDEEEDEDDMKLNEIYISTDRINHEYKSLSDLFIKQEIGILSGGFYLENYSTLEELNEQIEEHKDKNSTTISIHDNIPQNFLNDMQSGPEKVAFLVDVGEDPDTCRYLVRRMKKKGPLGYDWYVSDSNSNVGIQNLSFDAMSQWLKSKAKAPKFKLGYSSRRDQTKPDKDFIRAEFYPNKIKIPCNLNEKINQKDFNNGQEILSFDDLNALIRAQDKGPKILTSIYNDNFKNKIKVIDAEKIKMSFLVDCQKTHTTSRYRVYREKGNDGWHLQGPGAQNQGFPKTVTELIDWLDTQKNDSTVTLGYHSDFAKHGQSSISNRSSKQIDHEYGLVTSDFMQYGMGIESGFNLSNYTNLEALNKDEKNDKTISIHKKIPSNFLKNIGKQSTPDEVAFLVDVKEKGDCRYLVHRMKKYGSWTTEKDWWITSSNPNEWGSKGNQKNLNFSGMSSWLKTKASDYENTFTLGHDSKLFDQPNNSLNPKNEINEIEEEKKKTTKENANLRLTKTFLANEFDLGQKKALKDIDRNINKKAFKAKDQILSFDALNAFIKKKNKTEKIIASQWSDNFKNKLYEINRKNTSMDFLVDCQENCIQKRYVVFQRNRQWNLVSAEGNTIIVTPYQNLSELKNWLNDDDNRTSVTLGYHSRFEKYGSEKSEEIMEIDDENVDPKQKLKEQNKQLNIAAIKKMFEIENNEVIKNLENEINEKQNGILPFDEINTFIQENHSERSFIKKTNNLHTIMIKMSLIGDKTPGTFMVDFEDSEERPQRTVFTRLADGTWKIRAPDRLEHLIGDPIDNFNAALSRLESLANEESFAINYRPSLFKKLNKKKTQEALNKVNIQDRSSDKLGNAYLSNRFLGIISGESFDLKSKSYSYRLTAKEMNTALHEKSALATVKQWTIKKNDKRGDVLVKDSLKRGNTYLVDYEKRRTLIFESQSGWLIQTSTQNLYAGEGKQGLDRVNNWLKTQNRQADLRVTCVS